MLVTHHRASWTNLSAYNGPINYPGFPVEKSMLESLEEPVRSSVERENYYIDRNIMLEKIKPAIDKRAQTGINLYCGEFGCIRHTPHKIKCNWYRDIVSIFREFGISFTHWDMRGDFGILNGTEENREIINILTK
jgi:endoglucanase